MSRRTGSPSGIDRRDPARHRGEENLRFEPRQHRADAEMDPGAEGDVLRNLARDVEPVRVAPLPRVAIRGAEKRQHFLFGSDRDARDFDRARRRAEECRDRRFEPQRFLECGARQGRVRMQQRPLFGSVYKTVERVADAVDGRVEPGRKQRSHQQRGLVGIDLAAIYRDIDVGAETARSQRFATALREDPRTDARCIGECRGEARAVRRTVGVKHRISVRRKVFAAVRRQADRVRKHFERKRVRAIGHRIEPPRATSPSTSAAARVSNISRIRRSAVGESTRESTARVRVCSGGSASRIRLGGRHGFAGVKISHADAAARTVGLPIVEHRVDVGMTGHRPAPYFSNRTTASEIAQFGVHRVRLQQQFVAERIEVRVRELRPATSRRSGAVCSASRAPDRRMRKVAQIPRSDITYATLAGGCPHGPVGSTTRASVWREDYRNHGSS